MMHVKKGIIGGVLGAAVGWLAVGGTVAAAVGAGIGFAATKLIHHHHRQQWGGDQGYQG